MSTKLSKAFKVWPHGTVAATRWFESIGIARQQLASFQRAGWLESLGHGAYKRSDDTTLSWEGSVYALQRHYDYKLHVGARTALELEGLAYNMRFGTPMIFLLTRDRNFLPGWAADPKQSAGTFTLIRMRLFANGIDETEDYHATNANFFITKSCREQALLEMLAVAGKNQDLDEALHVFEKTRTVNVAKMQKLLESCTSVKAKRLFMVMAQFFQMDWLHLINANRIDFGSGPRMLVREGHYVKDFQISVPKEWFDDVSIPF